MKLTIDLTAEDVRKLISQKISAECSKHGYPASMGPLIVVYQREGTPIRLADLEIAIHAEVEVP